MANGRTQGANEKSAAVWQIDQAAATRLADCPRVAGYLACCGRRNLSDETIAAGLVKAAADPAFAAEVRRVWPEVDLAVLVKQAAPPSPKPIPQPDRPAPAGSIWDPDKGKWKMDPNSRSGVKVRDWYNPLTWWGGTDIEDSWSHQHIGATPKHYDVKAMQQEYSNQGYDPVRAANMAARDRARVLYKPSGRATRGSYLGELGANLADTAPSMLGGRGTWGSFFTDPRSLVGGPVRAFGGATKAPFGLGSALAIRSGDDAKASLRDVFAVALDPLEAGSGLASQPGIGERVTQWGNDVANAYADPAAFASELAAGNDVTKWLQQAQQMSPEEWARYGIGDRLGLPQARSWNDLVRMSASGNPLAKKLLQTAASTLEDREAGRIKFREHLAERGANAGWLERIAGRTGGNMAAISPTLSQMATGAVLTGGLAGGAGRALGAGGRALGAGTSGGIRGTLGNWLARGGKRLVRGGNWVSGTGTSIPKYSLMYDPLLYGSNAALDETPLGAARRGWVNSLRNNGDFGSNVAANALELGPGVLLPLAAGKSMAAAKFLPNTLRGVGRQAGTALTDDLLMTGAASLTPGGPGLPQKQFEAGEEWMPSWSNPLTEEQKNTLTELAKSQGAPLISAEELARQPTQQEVQLSADMSQQLAEAATTAPDGTPLPPEQIEQRMRAIQQQLLRGTDPKTILTMAQGMAQGEPAAVATGAGNMAEELDQKPQDVVGLFNAMGTGEKTLLGLGLGLGALGLVSAIAGRGGIMSWLATLLGFGIAGGVGANAGMFGPEAKEWLSSLFAGGEQPAEEGPREPPEPVQPPAAPAQPQAPAAGQPAQAKTPDLVQDVLSDGQISKQERGQIFADPPSLEYLMSQPDDVLVNYMRNAAGNDPAFKKQLKTIGSSPRSAMWVLTAPKGTKRFGYPGMGMAEDQAKRLIAIAGQI